MKVIKSHVNLKISPFLWSSHGLSGSHNYQCAVCTDKQAVLQINEGVLLPCWDCQKKGYAMVKLNWFQKMFVKQIGEL